MKRLKLLRQKKGISQKDLAADLRVAPNTLNQWENGKRAPSYDVVVSLAEYFNVSVDYLLGRESSVRQHAEPNPSRPRGVRIKVYGNVAAGVPIDAIDNFDEDDPDDWEEIDEKTARSGEFFALRIKGDSMEPKISDGDIVIVRLQPEVANGDIAIVCVNGDEATCKKIKKTPEGIMLISLNPAYEPMYYSNAEIENLPLTFLGKVIERRSKFY